MGAGIKVKGEMPTAARKQNTMENTNTITATTARKNSRKLKTAIRRGSARR